MLVDTSFWLALADRGDPHHAESVILLREHDEPLVTTWPVISETAARLLAVLGVESQLIFLRCAQDKAMTICELDVTSLLDYTQRFLDAPISLAHASLLVAADITRQRNVFSFERDGLMRYALSGGAKLQVVGS